MDFDNDGDLDLVVNCPDKPSNGVYFFENSNGDTSVHKMPIFEPGQRISKGLHNTQVSYVEGKPRVLIPGVEFPNFPKTGLEEGRTLPIPPNPHSKPLRGNMWKYVDYEGDSDTDIVVGTDDWSEYGWDDAYDADGRWKNGPLLGNVYLIRNRGSDEAPVYETPERLLAGDKPLQTYGWPSPNFEDFDKDGDLDIICGEFLDGFLYFENTGTRGNPVYNEGKRLTLTSRNKVAAFPSAWLASEQVAKQARNRLPLTMDLQMITPTAIDWDKDGDPDLITGDEDGRVAFVENTGRLGVDGIPQFLPPRYFQQKADELKFGALATPYGFDWDGDGDTDILSGNTAGYIGYFENMSGNGVEFPKWAAPSRLKADGKTIRITAGYNGSIQGPAEAKWGYSALSVADWDSDGLPDLLVNSILGRVVWYRNIGTRKSPRLASARPIEVEWQGAQPRLSFGWQHPEGKALLTQWRTTPSAIDWDKDGMTDLVMLDHEGYLALFRRVKQNGKPILLPPERILMMLSGEETSNASLPIRLTSLKGGKSGRRKIAITDWDMDGDYDILVNSTSASLLEQVSAGPRGYFFRDRGPITPQDIEGHDVSPSVVDFNDDGVPDFVGGAEDGKFYYLRNSRSNTAAPPHP